MCVVPKAANDMMQVGRLQGFDVSLLNLAPVFFFNKRMGFFTLRSNVVGFFFTIHRIIFQYKNRCTKDMEPLPIYVTTIHVV